MASAVIDEMVVKLTADVSDLKKQLAEYKKEIGSTDKDSIKAEEEKVKLAKQRSGLLSKSMGQTASALKGAMGSILKLIGGLQVIKAVMQGVTKIIDEGRQNLYAYSKLTDGSLSKAMDRRNSAIAEFGNAFAAFESMITEALAPLITKLFEGLTDIFNKISQTVAELFDLPGYYQANFGIMKAWSTNLKETRMLLGSFDSLNLVSPLAENSPIEDQFTYVTNDGSKNGLKSLFDTIKSDALTAITSIKDYITNAFDLIDPSGRLTGIFDNISNTIGGIIRAVLGDEFADGLDELDFTKMKAGIDKFLEDTGLKGVIDSVVSLIEQLSGAISDIVNSEGFENFVDTLKTIISIISGITSTSIQLISDLFAVFRGEMTMSELWDNFTTNVADSIGKPFERLWKQIKAYFLGMVNDFLVTVHNAFSFLLGGKIQRSSVYDAYAQAYYEAFGEYPTTSVHISSSGVEHGGGGRHMDSDVKTTVEIPPDLKKEVDDWYKKNSMFQGTSKSIFDVPARAKGGVITAPTLTWVGEYAGAHNNPELITPQALLDERLQYNNRELLQGISGMTNNIVEAVSGISMDVRVGDSVIANASARGQRAAYLRTGRPLIS